MISEKNIYEWLIKTNSWTEYNTRINLLQQSNTHPEVVAARKKMLSNAQIQQLLLEVQQWPWIELKRHNDANHPLHKLIFLADIGLTKEIDGIKIIGEHLLQNQSSEGPFQIPIMVPKAYGGDDQAQLTWMLCDNPSIIYALIKFGWGDDARVKKALEHLVGLQSEQGWLCIVAPILGKFRGPGRKDDPCPYTTLISLKVLVNSSEYHSSDASRKAAEVLLELWKQRKERKPYLFAMGTDFLKLKAPLIWYDILHVVTVLSQCEWLRKDERLLEMINIIEEKADDQGKFTAESVWRPYKEWEFGQKKEPSPWITYLVYNILLKK